MEGGSKPDDRRGRAVTRGGGAARLPNRATEWAGPTRPGQEFTWRVGFESNGVAPLAASRSPPSPAGRTLISIHAEAGGDEREGLALSQNRELCSNPAARVSRNSGGRVRAPRIRLLPEKCCHQGAGRRHHTDHEHVRGLPTGSLADLGPTWCTCTPSRRPDESGIYFGYEAGARSQTNPWNGFRGFPRGAAHRRSTGRMGPGATSTPCAPTGRRKAPRAFVSGPTARCSIP